MALVVLVLVLVLMAESGVSGVSCSCGRVCWCKHNMFFFFVVAKTCSCTSKYWCAPTQVALVPCIVHCLHICMSSGLHCASAQGTSSRIVDENS